MKIELTEQQIEILTKGETEKLNEAYIAAKQKLEAKFNAELFRLESKLKSDMESLKDKFRYFEYETKKTKSVSPKETKTTRKRIDVAKLKEMLDEKKSVKEIAETFGTTQNSIRSKLYQLKIKLSDLK